MRSAKALRPRGTDEKKGALRASLQGEYISSGYRVWRQEGGHVCLGANLLPCLRDMTILEEVMPNLYEIPMTKGPPIHLINII